MRIDQVAEHAMAVAREVVALGLADRGQVRQLYRDYAQRVQHHGEGGSFVDALLAEGLIDQGGYQQLLERCPMPASATAGGEPPALQPDLGSQFWPRQQAPAPEDWREGSTRPSRPARPPSEAARPASDLTMAYEDVLPAPARGGPEGARGDSPDVTMGYDAVLDTPAPGWGALAPPMEEEFSAQAPGCDTTSSEAETGLAGDVHRQSSASQLKLAPDEVSEREAAFFAEGELPEGDGTMREPALNEVMGDYQLERVLGRGGMGVIFLAKKIGTEQRVALKALTVGVGEAGAKRRARFQREVEALRRLQHPNIVKVHDCGRKGSWDWYAMEHVEGQELKALIKDGALDRPQRLQVFLDICAAVQHAHERGVIHRDLKPANVLVTAAPELRVCVLDFGLAKIADEGLELTKTGAALGTPYYMAPEQLLSPRDVDHRSDVWSLGVLLYELLLGERPFTGETAGEVGTKIMQAEPARPSKLNPGLHASLDAIVLKALSKDPAHRYQDVEALRRDVAKFRRGSSLRAMTDLDAWGEFVRRWLYQNRMAVLVGFLIASLVYWPAIFFVYAFM